jgi:PAS domain S-box-containing protein/diguanylate cyclase (GGDEF)-like protein
MLEIPSPNIFQAIVDRIETGVFALDLDRKISYWNYGAEKITGFLSHDVLGRPCSDSILVEYDDHNPLLCMHQCPLENTRGDGARREAITYIRHRSGHVVSVRLWTMALKDRAGEIVGAVKVFSERVCSPELSIADAARGRQQDLDIETGIPSRAGTESFLRQQIEASEKQRVPCGIIAIRLEGLDGFRHAHGMEASGAILREVSRTLKDMMRRTDFLGRWGVDCFLAILPGCGIDPLERVAARMKRVASRVAIPWWGDRLSVEMSAQITMLEAGDAVEPIEARLGAWEEKSGSTADGNGRGA